MKTMVKLATASLLALTVTACATGPKLAPAGSFQVGSYSVPLSQDWTSVEIKTDKGQKGSLLTMDGTNLNTVHLYSDIKDGDSLMKERKKENPVPKYSSDMTELDYVEFLTQSIERGYGFLNVTAENVEPTTFKGEDAVKFDFTAVTEKGLNMSGSSLMGAVDEKLNVVLYMAPSVYYYGKQKAEVDAMMNSLAE